MSDKGNRLAAIKREIESAQREAAMWIDEIDERSKGAVTQEARDEILGVIAALGRDFRVILEEAEDETESAESKAEDADGARQEAEEALGEILSGDDCPLCGTALLSGETALDVADAARDCRGCRAAREREEEFHRRNPGVRAAARDPLAGIL